MDNSLAKICAYVNNCDKYDVWDIVEMQKNVFSMENYTLKDGIV